MVSNKFIDVKSHNPKAVAPKDYKFNKIQHSPKVLEVKNGIFRLSKN